MPSLRQHSKDVAIGAISQANLEMIADIVEAASERAQHPLWRWLSPWRKRRMDLKLTAATLSRVRGVPEPLPAGFSELVTIAMGARE